MQPSDRSSGLTNLRLFARPLNTDTVLLKNRPERHRCRPGTGLGITLKPLERRRVERCRPKRSSDPCSRRSDLVGIADVEHVGLDPLIGQGLQHARFDVGGQNALEHPAS